MENTDSAMPDEAGLLSITKRFRIEGASSVQKLNEGVVNDTYIVESASAKQKYILQKLHKIFSFDLLYDIEAVTSHLAGYGLTTPILVYTDDGQPGLRQGLDIWRMMTYINGRTVKKASPSLANSAGKMLARFHNAFLEFNYEFKHKIPGFHDTANSVKILKQLVSGIIDTEKFKELEKLADFVFEEYEKEDYDFSSLPKRVVHGDPKISNFIFDSNRDRALCLVDPDTVSLDYIVIEIGDAIRSWCHLQEKNISRFDKNIFEAFIRGFFAAASFLTNGEISEIIKGLRFVSLDLCTRYITDAFEEKYFRLDSSRYVSLYEQNRIKASGLADFHRETQKNERQLKGLIESCRVI